MLRVVVTVLGLVLIYPVFAATEAVTDDGRKVRLFDDQTWEYIESATDDPSVEVLDLHLVSASN